MDQPQRGLWVSCRFDILAIDDESIEPYSSLASTICAYV